jgi:hypothetical protein
MSHAMQLFDNLVQEFNGALDRAVAAHENKASKAAADEIHYADDIYETIAEEIRLQGLREPIEGIPPLADLYSRLKKIESIVIPTTQAD